jgi:hypothetical protein
MLAFDISIGVRWDPHQRKAGGNDFFCFKKKKERKAGGYTHWP